MSPVNSVSPTAMYIKSETPFIAGIVVCLFLAWISCSSPGKEHQYLELDNPVSPQDSALYKNNVRCKDSLYSKRFIQDLKRHFIFSYDIVLSGGMLIYNSRDTVYFPKFPELNKKTFFQKRSADSIYTLVIERDLYTSIKYDFKVFCKGLLTFADKGVAEVSALNYKAPKRNPLDSLNLYSINDYDNLQKKISTSILFDPFNQSFARIVIVHDNGAYHFPNLRLTTGIIFNNGAGRL